MQIVVYWSGEWHCALSWFTPPAGGQEVETAYIERKPFFKLSKIRRNGLVLFREFYWDVLQNTVEGVAVPG